MDQEGKTIHQNQLDDQRVDLTLIEQCSRKEKLHDAAFFKVCDYERLETYLQGKISSRFAIIGSLLLISSMIIALIVFFVVLFKVTTEFSQMLPSGRYPIISIGLPGVLAGLIAAGILIVAGFLLSYLLERILFSPKYAEIPVADVPGLTNQLV